MKVITLPLSLGPVPETRMCASDVRGREREAEGGGDRYVDTRSREG